MFSIEDKDEEILEPFQRISLQLDLELSNQETWIATCDANKNSMFKKILSLGSKLNFLSCIFGGIIKYTKYIEVEFFSI